MQREQAMEKAGHDLRMHQADFLQQCVKLFEIIVYIGWEALFNYLTSGSLFGSTV